MISKHIHRLVKQTNQIVFRYRTLSPGDYIHNQREANMVTTPQTTILKPLQNCNHGEGTSDEIALFGAPLGVTKEQFKNYDTIASAITQSPPDLIFLQLDPSPYIARQRFLSHKCALQEVEDYSKHALESMDLTKPDSWEECVVNLVVLDMLKKNQAHTEFDFTDTFATYSYPYIQDKSITESLKEPFIQSINENVIYQNFSPYYLINRALYTGLMGKQQVMLGGMPESLSRLIIGNDVTLEEMKDLFKDTLMKMKELKVPMTLNEAATNFAPHVFQKPKDLYMTAMLKQAFQASTNMLAFVGVHHFNPIQRYWQGAPTGINFEQATTPRQRIRGETDEMLIQKQALLDVMLDTRVWGEQYIANPFPYVNKDLTAISDKDFTNMKKCFADNYKKYSLFQNQSIKELPNFSQKQKLSIIGGVQNIKPIEKIASQPKETVQQIEAQAKK